MNYRQITATLLLLCLQLMAFAQNQIPVTGIIGALDREITLLESRLTEKKTMKIQGLTFVTGRIKNRRVVITKTGVGKVNAAMTATLLIEHFKPNEVIFTGIAGSINPTLLPGDIVVATQTAQYDFGTLKPDGFMTWGPVNPINNQRNPVFFPAAPHLLLLAENSIKSVRMNKIKVGRAEKLPKAVKGVVITGDMFVASTSKSMQLRKDFMADAVEMEGGAVAQICFQQNTPCIVIRCMSDTADENAHTDYEEFINIAALNSSNFVANMVEQLSN